MPTSRIVGGLKFLAVVAAFEDITVGTEAVAAVVVWQLGDVIKLHIHNKEIIKIQKMRNVKGVVRR